MNIARRPDHHIATHLDLCRLVPASGRERIPHENYRLQEPRTATTATPRHTRVLVAHGVR
jgi:hypothetical protein